MPFEQLIKLRNILGGICAVLALVAMLWFATRPASAADGPPEVLDAQIAAQYVRPHDRIDIGGRSLNLYCIGEGEQVVLFEAGGSDWSVIWALVQPRLAGNFRACSYDRAGMGYSDPSPLPRTPTAIVEDLKSLVEAAKLPKPLILVGHSLGGFNAKLYTAFYPQDVAGLVLVDPSEDRQADRSRAFLTRKYGPLVTARSELTDIAWFGYLFDRYSTCAGIAAEKPLDPASTAYRHCADPVRPALGPAIAAERLRIQVTPRYQQTQASEILNSVYGDPRSDPTYARLFRKGAFKSMPLIVLTHGNVNRADPADVLSQEAMIELHRETAGLSKLGIQRTVQGTGHNIEIDKPLAVVDAIEEIGRSIGQRRVQNSSRRPANSRSGT